MTALEISKMTRASARGLGVDLREPLTADVRRDPRRPVVAPGAGVPGQCLTPDQHVAFARQFGEITTRPCRPRTASPEINVLDMVDPKGNGSDRCTATARSSKPDGRDVPQRSDDPSTGGHVLRNMYDAYDT